MQTVLLWLFYISSFYAFIPGIITRFFGYRVFRRGTVEGEFALTFDDGPDPVYTPQLLDLLKRYNMKATFFVVGSHAESHPEIIKRIHDEGHLIGIHNYVHKSNWLMRPKTVRMQLKRTDDIIFGITGERPVYYRPPWGIVNLFDFAKNSGYRIILWSSMYGDWRSSVGADKLTHRMRRKLRAGEVMLLHDCGNTMGADVQAPEQMLLALDRVLSEAEREGLRSVRIDEMITHERMSSSMKLSLPKRMAVAVWLLWEKLFHVVFRLKTANPSDPMLHYRLTSYQGQDMVTQDGLRLVKGDEVLELHFDNQKLFDIGRHARNEMQIAIQMIRAVQKDLPTIAQRVLDKPEYRNVKGLYGVTMITRGPEQFGFHLQDLPSGLFASSTRVYLKLLLSVIHPKGQSRLKEGSRRMEPRMLMMPVEVLISRYAPRELRSRRSSVETGLGELSVGSTAKELSS
ncbi:polysaccharide deacetylase family protein [Paenibacillus sp. F411]|uniref:Polysaccharide deacetylase n=1 Tax=Paenibacillus algicola TaxID=2565926 RepID=A0A4P8XI73_9BACL|nr:MULTISPECIES: polysaccharide deacetylase family protein [Paenibacillus]MBO2943365.1 polysaccharide deacetylase family protein [Paenibacillus sp. F411]QCT02065.1 polysaccharide deacetylase [Paenibacillus algicola]